MVLRNQITSFREAGLDEAGRGCLAGPVTAAAVILPLNVKITGITDSKKLSPQRRAELRWQIEEYALDWSVAHITPSEIDRLNILNASIQAMHRCVEQLSRPPEFLAVDGNRFVPLGSIPYEAVVRGDGRYKNIAAASILAKTHRDEYMLRLSEEFPDYGWERNKGYPTREHRRAIERLGPCVWHRQSFRLLEKIEG